MAIPKTPVSYKDFAKNPLTAMLFMAISGLSYFVYENKAEMNACKDEIKAMQIELKGAVEEIKTLRQDNGALRAELNTRKELSKF
jgi:heme oxygenase